MREEVPDITLRTTVLVGYPGETDADAAELVDFVRTYGIGRLGAFAYSPEEGTPAFELEGEVPGEIAQERLAAVLGARDEVLRAGQEAMVGRTMEVLVDEIDLEAGIAVGHGAMDAPEVDPVVIAPADGSNVGERLQVQVAGVDAEFNLLGEGIFVED